MIIPNHWHFLIIAYEKFDKETGKIDGMSRVEIIDCDTADEAIKRAKEKIKRNGYLLEKAWQCSTCLNQLRLAETQSRMAKSMKKHLDE